MKVFKVLLIILILFNNTFCFSQNKIMDNATKEIMLQGKEAIITHAFDILEKNVATLKINLKDYEIKVWANKTNAFVKFKRRIQYKPLKSDHLEYNISVDIINKKVSPFENGGKDTSYIPTKQEKEKIEFVKKNGGLAYKGFVCKIVEEIDKYWISITNKYSFSKFYIDKITGEKSPVMQGSYTVGPIIKGHILNENPLKEIYESTTPAEIHDIISTKKSSDPDFNEFAEITDFLSVKEFEKIKNFILKKGDGRTYRNMDNYNPHYHFDDFHVYLNSAIGQKNINNDPKISDFNEITIHDWDDGAFNIQYYTIKIVRRGDIKNEQIYVEEGMKEKSVYLLNSYEKDLNLMLKNLKEHYLVKLRGQIN